VVEVEGDQELDEALAALVLDLGQAAMHGRVVWDHGTHQGTKRHEM
jgi:hypothetical protein